jgi:hypothetical protein
MKTALVVLALTLTACGSLPTTTIVSGTPECQNGIMGIASNCKTGTAAPTPTPAPSIGLVFSGDIPTPPPSGYTNQGHVRVPSGTPSSWQALGVNNQPAITKTVATTMQVAGDCRQVDVKVLVSNASPANSGTWYLSTNGNRFQVCQDGDKVTVEFEDGVDSLYNDYKISIAATNGQPVVYKWVGNQLQICLD